jgi:HTH-type transcriptional regulator / antitoxin MqsA
MDTKCPLCGTGHVSVVSEWVETTYKGEVAHVPQQHRTCDHCGSDFAGKADMDATRQALLAWRNEIDDQGAMEAR